MARCVWALVDEELTEHILSNMEENPKLWLFSLLDSVCHNSFTKLLITCWAIWGARRKAIHEGIFQSPFLTYTVINKLLESMNLSATCRADMKLKCSGNASVSRWVAPPSNFMKINVDAAVARSGGSDAVGAICRDSNGLFIAASARVFDGISEPATLEALACNEALSLALDNNLSRCLIATDCLEVIRNLEEKSLCPYSAILNEIQLRKNIVGEVHFKHESRKCNGEAHSLVKGVCSFAPGRYIWFIRPPEFLHVPMNILFK